MKAFIREVLLLLLCSWILTVSPINGSRERKYDMDMIMPRILVEEFSYTPKREGYRYSYKLPDGTTREEVGFILNPDKPSADLVIMGAFSRTNRDAVTTTIFTYDRSGYRARANVKNRKLSPKVLMSLTG